MGAQVSSTELELLQSELICLSKALQDTYTSLYTGIQNLSEEWRDEKFEEFETSFRSRQEKIRELSETYESFATEFLPPRIELIKEAENKSVSK